MKTTNRRLLGRYRNEKTGQTVNIHKARKVGYGVDVLFFIRSGERVFIGDADFYREWKKIS